MGGPTKVKNKKDFVHAQRWGGFWKRWVKNYAKTICGPSRKFDDRRATRLDAKSERVRPTWILQARHTGNGAGGEICDHPSEKRSEHALAPTPKKKSAWGCGLANRFGRGSALDKLFEYAYDPLFSRNVKVAPRVGAATPPTKGSVVSGSIFFGALWGGITFGPAAKRRGDCHVMRQPTVFFYSSHPHGIIFSVSSIVVFLFTYVILNRSTRASSAFLILFILKYFIFNTFGCWSGHV